MSSRTFVLDHPTKVPLTSVLDHPTKVPLTSRDGPPDTNILASVYRIGNLKEPCLKPREWCTIGMGCPPGGGGGALTFGKIIELLSRLSPEHQRSVIDMIRGLATAEGIEDSDIAQGEPEPLGHYIPAWQNSLRKFTPRSKELYRYYVERALANIPPPITTIAIEGYIASLLERLSPNAVKNELKALKSFFGFLLDRNIIPSDPTAKIDHPQIVRQQKVCPTRDEVAKFLAVLTVATNLRAKLMMALLINTGIRFTEMATIPWGKVDLERCEITILGKGGKWRRVPIAVEVRDFLAELRNGHTDNELLFPTESKKGVWDNSDANKMIARLCRRAGIRRYTCHQFRHFFATQTRKAGAPLKVVQELLGHAHAATTLNFYDHTDEEEVRKAHEAFAPLLGEVLKPKEDRKRGGSNNGKTD